MKWLCLVLVAFTLFQSIVSPPVDKKKAAKGKENESEKEAEDLGLEYGRYLQQVVQILEEDQDFAKKLENVTSEEIKSGLVAKELEFVKHSVRTKLDELKRMEMDRLRSLVRQEMERNELGLDRDAEGHPKHIDSRNPHTFEVEDLRKLIKTASKDLDKLNEQRKEEFKTYEMEKKHKYEETLKHMTEEERKVAEAKHQESINRHKEHPKVHHPGSKQQLEQVWEEQDQLPREEFNPRTFFAMHDINGDGYLDEDEVEALLTIEVKKMYDLNNTDDDPVEMMEEYHRMRDHIYNETDANHDRMISLDEFVDMTRRREFEQDDGWKGLDEDQVFSEDDFAAYERMQQEEYMRTHGGQAQQHHPINGQYVPPPHQYDPNYPQGVPQYHPGYPQGGQPLHPQGGQPMYPQGGQPQYPQGGQPQYPQGGQPQYPQGGQPQYPQGGQAQHYPPPPNAQMHPQQVYQPPPNNQGYQQPPPHPQGKNPVPQHPQGYQQPAQHPVGQGQQIPPAYPSQGQYQPPVQQAAQGVPVNTVTVQGGPPALPVQGGQAQPGVVPQQTGGQPGVQPVVSQVASSDKPTV